MKRLAILFFLSVSTFLSFAAPDNIPVAYQADYASLVGKSGVTLFDAVSTIAAKGYRTHSYKDLWTYFRETDADASGYVWDMYSDCRFVFGTDQCGNVGSVCKCYNREHSLPKSWFGGSDSNAPGTDLFHLVPTDGKVNGQRSNYPFGECAQGTYLSNKARGRLGSSTFPGYSSVGTVFEPDDVYKGDFARGYMGMIVRYGKQYEFNQADGGEEMFSNSGKKITAANHYGFTAYSVALLMKWHAADQVSSKETTRNNGIQRTQGNRNPFIDCPVLADYFWGSKAGQTVTRQDLLDCGCFDANRTPVEDIVAAGALSSMTWNIAGGVLMLSTLPERAQIHLFTPMGVLLDVTSATDQQANISLEHLTPGIYLVVVSDGTNTRSITILH